MNIGLAFLAGYLFCVSITELSTRPAKYGIIFAVLLAMGAGGGFEWIWR